MAGIAITRRELTASELRATAAQTCGMDRQTLR